MPNLVSLALKVPEIKWFIQTAIVETPKNSYLHMRFVQKATDFNRYMLGGLCVLCLIIQAQLSRQSLQHELGSLPTAPGRLGTWAPALLSIRSCLLCRGTCPTYWAKVITNRIPHGLASTNMKTIWILCGISSDG